jgi:hypothetical protein
MMPVQTTPRPYQVEDSDGANAQVIRLRFDEHNDVAVGPALRVEWQHQRAQLHRNISELQAELDYLDALLAVSVPRARASRDNDEWQVRVQAGERLRALMTEKSMSLRQLAKATYYNAGYLSRVVNGVKPLSHKLAGQLDVAFGVTEFTAMLAAVPQERL